MFWIKVPGYAGLISGLGDDDLRMYLKITLTSNYMNTNFGRGFGMNNRKQGYFIHLNELAGASLLPVCAIYLGYEKAAYFFLFILTIPFLIGRKERRALLEGKVYEWVLVVMPFIMTGIFSLTVIELKIRAFILLALWLGAVIYSSIVLHES